MLRSLAAESSTACARVASKSLTRCASDDGPSRPRIRDLSAEVVAWVSPGAASSRATPAGTSRTPIDMDMPTPCAQIGEARAQSPASQQPAAVANIAMPTGSFSRRYARARQPGTSRAAAPSQPLCDFSSSTVTCSRAASSASWGAVNPVTLSLATFWRCTCPPAAETSPASLALSCVLTCRWGAGRIGGGAGTCSPSSVRSTRRSAEPNARTTGVDTKSSTGCENGTAVAKKPAIASGRLTIAYLNSARARRVKGARNTRRTGDDAAVGTARFMMEFSPVSTRLSYRRAASVRMLRCSRLEAGDVDRGATRIRGSANTTFERPVNRRLRTGRASLDICRLHV
jgi:hypothetical protein